MNIKSEVSDNNLIGVSKEEYGDRYHEHLLEQYKVYVQLTDKISERRTSANTFFLTVNTGLISAIGISGLAFGKSSGFLLIIVSFSAIALCYTWYRLIRSYKDLNTGKFKVIHEIEKYLPLRPYDAEWKAIGEGKNKKLYLPFTHIEIYVPWIFKALYVALMLYGFYLI